jgi:hypothetical protein
MGHLGGRRREERDEGSVVKLKMAGNLTKNGGKRNKNGGKPSNNSGKRSIFIYDWLETLTFFSRWRFLRQNWHLAQHS